MDRHVFTRDAIQAALDAADLDIPGTAWYARRIEFDTRTCLAYEIADLPADFLAFAHVVSGLLPEPQRLDFLTAARPAASGGIVIWPGYRLDEPTEDQIVDASNSLAAIGAP